MVKKDRVNNENKICLHARTVLFIYSQSLHRGGGDCSSSPSSPLPFKNVPAVELVLNGGGATLLLGALRFEAL